MFGVLAVVGVGIASAATNHGFRQYILSQWLTRVVTGLPARAVAILAFAATLLTGIPAFVCVRKFLRSWWSGLHSLLVPTGVVLAWAILVGTLTDLKVLTAIVFVLLVFEISRWRVDYSRVAFPLPVFPICGAQAETLWRQKRDDDSIKDPREDLIGRTATLELLARCALQDRMPIVALKGAYGDGKTSVLNLLEQPLSKSALVVPFKSWLTGSEAGLVGALLRDISLTVNKHLYVPKLRRRTLAFLRIITGTASQLGGIKEIIPIHTQADEFRELASTLKRVPRPVVVLLDELDRMEAGEALALFKLLRGASALPNLTFICTFSETDLRRIVGSVAGGSEDYLEKFFPASIRLPAPTGDLLGRSLLDRLILFLRRQKAFQSADEQKCFREDFEKVWNDCLQHVVRNLRRAGRLAIEVEMAHAPVGGEVEPLDVILLEALRLAFPEIHEKVRLSGDRLTDMQTLDPLAVVEEQSKKFIQELELLVAPKPEAHHILGWLFPDYDKRRQFAYKRAWEKTERRAWRSDRFQIYFRSAVPGEIFSEAETREIMDALRGSNGLEAARRILQDRFDSLSSVHAKRADFLSRLRFRVGEMPPEVAGDIAVSICLMAFGFRDDDTWTFSESAQALQIVLTACNHAKEEHRGQLIQRSILAASDVTFAYRLLKSVRDGRNNFGSASRDLALVTLAELAFVELMRQRYAPGRTPQMEDADHEVFREWMDLSNEDLPLVRLCFEFFVGTSPKKLAQVTRIVYPEGIWRSDPRDIVERFLSLNTMRVILTESPRGDLTAQEMTELERLERFVVYREYRADPRGGFIRLPDDGPA